MTRHHPAAVPVDPTGDHLAVLLGAVANLNDTMAQFSTGIKTRDAQRLLGADARPFTLGGTIAPFPTVGQSSGLLLGLCFRELTGNAVTLRVLDGQDSSGALLWTGVCAGGGDRTVNFAAGIAYTNGVFVIVQQGVVEGVVYIGAGRPATR